MKLFKVEFVTQCGHPGFILYSPFVKFVDDSNDVRTEPCFTSTLPPEAENAYDVTSLNDELLLIEQRLL